MLLRGSMRSRAVLGVLILASVSLGGCIGDEALPGMGEFGRKARDGRDEHLEDASPSGRGASPTSAAAVDLQTGSSHTEGRI